MTTHLPPRRRGFTFSSSGTAEYIAKVDVAAFHDDRCTVAELIRRALREYIAGSNQFPEAFKSEFAAVDLHQQNTAVRRNRFSDERKALEIAEREALIAAGKQLL